MSEKSEAKTATEAEIAAYDHVQKLWPDVPAPDGYGHLYYGHQVREAFEAGVEWLTGQCMQRAVEVDMMDVRNPGCRGMYGIFKQPEPVVPLAEITKLVKGM